MPRAYYKPQSLLEEALQKSNFKLITNCLFVLFLSSSIALCTVTKIFSNSRYTANNKSWWQQRRELEQQREEHLQEYEQQSELHHPTEYTAVSNTDSKVESTTQMPILSQQQRERRRRRRDAFIPPEFPA